MNPETVWQTALGELQLQMTKATFDTWLKHSSVVAYEDGTFIVSDFIGNRVYTVTPDRSTVTALAEIPSPADIGLNRQEGLLFVPQFMEDKLSVYKLKK